MKTTRVAHWLDPAEFVVMSQAGNYPPFYDYFNLTLESTSQVPYNLADERRGVWTPIVYPWRRGAAAIQSGERDGRVFSSIPDTRRTSSASHEGFGGHLHIMLSMTFVIGKAGNVRGCCNHIVNSYIAQRSVSRKHVLSGKIYV